MWKQEPWNSVPVSVGSLVVPLGVGVEYTSDGGKTCNNSILD